MELALNQIAVLRIRSFTLWPWKKIVYCISRFKTSQIATIILFTYAFVRKIEKKDPYEQKNTKPPSRYSRPQRANQLTKSLSFSNPPVTIPHPVCAVPRPSPTPQPCWIGAAAMGNEEHERSSYPPPLALSIFRLLCSLLFVLAALVLVPSSTGSGRHFPGFDRDALHAY